MNIQVAGLLGGALMLIVWRRRKRRRVARARSPLGRHELGDRVDSPSSMASPMSRSRLNGAAVVTPTNERFEATTSWVRMSTFG